MPHPKRRSNPTFFTLTCQVIMPDLTPIGHFLNLKFFYQWMYATIAIECNWNTKISQDVQSSGLSEKIHGFFELFQNCWRWQTIVECISNGTFSWESVFSTSTVKSVLAKKSESTYFGKKRENEEEDYSEKNNAFIHSKGWKFYQNRKSENMLVVLLSLSGKIYRSDWGFWKTSSLYEISFLWENTNAGWFTIDRTNNTDDNKIKRPFYEHKRAFTSSVSMRKELLRFQ